MDDTIAFKDRFYHHYAYLLPESDDAAAHPCAVALRDGAEDRQSYFKKKRKMKLNNTVGAFVPVGEHHIVRFVVDKRSVAYGSPQWRLIAAAAKCLDECHAKLSEQGKAALEALKAVVFCKPVKRSYADVGPDIFFYDIDEFLTSDGTTLVTPAWVASNIVHDAYHVWLHDHDRHWHGEDAEVICWKLQVENRDAFGLSEIEVRHLEALIANPQSQLGRMGSDVI